MLSDTDACLKLEVLSHQKFQFVALWDLHIIQDILQSWKQHIRKPIPYSFLMFVQGVGHVFLCHDVASRLNLQANHDDAVKRASKSGRKSILIIEGVVGPGTNELDGVLLALIQLVGHYGPQIVHHRCCSKRLVSGPPETTDPTATERRKQPKTQMLACQAVLHVENLQRFEQSCNMIS